MQMRSTVLSGEINQRTKTPEKGIKSLRDIIDALLHNVDY